MLKKNSKTMRINGLAVAAWIACGLAGSSAAWACDAAKRPTMSPSPALAQNVASMEKIGLFRANPAGAAKANDVVTPTITGLWHSVYFYSGQMVDQSFETYHSDGTEMEVDLGPPAVGNVCNGTWEQTGTLTYKLTHPAWTFDDNGNLTGMIVIRDVVTLDLGGNTFSGTEAIDEFDINGEFVSRSEGTVKSTRVIPN